MPKNESNFEDWYEGEDVTEDGVEGVDRPVVAFC